MYIPYEERVKMIDSSLEFVEALLPFNRGFLFRVKKNGKDYVLKGCENDKEHIQAVNREKVALRRADIIKDVPKLVRDYGWVEGDYTFLKEYIPGKIMYSVDPSLIIGRGLKKDLRSMVLKLHLIGVSHLDLEPRNILISPDYTKARLFDFDNAITNKGYNAPLFALAVAKDISNLNRLNL